MRTASETLLKSRTKIMGILNLTPDSFYDGGKYIGDKISGQIEKMIQYGADIIDVGAESSRPGAEPVSYAEELLRLEPVFKVVSKFDVLFSIDTYKPRIAQTAIDNGFHIVNDITGGGKSGKMFSIASENNIPIVIMHMLGNPMTMQNKPIYANVIDSIIDYFKQRIKLAKSFGVEDYNIILDPGIGFGKTKSDNDEILMKLSLIKSLGYSVLIGTSRKSFLKLDNDEPKDRLPASISSMTLAIANGADIVRAHDVKESYQSIRITDRIIGNIEVN